MNASIVMTPGRFTLDTNILVYVIDRDAGFKHRLAQDILRRSTGKDCWLTLQSISEFYSVVIRKKIVGHLEAAGQVDDWMTLFPTIPATANAIRAAIDHSRSGRTSFWDGLLIESALGGGCAIVVTEDLQDGATVGGTAICHPFAGEALAPNLEALLT
jgi:predicted nucleic acid-binding protein